MTQEELQKKLRASAEEEYQKFSSALVPGVKNMLGIRLPKLRVLARGMAKEEWREYLSWDCFLYFEEVMIQGMILGYAEAPIGELLQYAAGFIPRIDNWSVNDSFCTTFHAAKKNRARVWEFLMRYQNSHREYEIRVVAVMLMSHFLVPEYIERVLAVLKNLDTEPYYASMAVAWAFAEAWAKYPEETKRCLVIGDGIALDKKTAIRMLQKCIESRRIPEKEKDWMRTERSRIRRRNA